MLPATHRLTGGDTYRRAVRSGRKAGSATVVVHLDDHGPDPATGETGARVGFVVSRTVGTAVVRNRVKRRLRHAAREHLGSLSASSVLVVRALPAAAAASYPELRADLARCLERVS